MLFPDGNLGLAAGPSIARRLGRTPALAAGILVFIMGVILLFVGISNLADTTITCHEALMRPGDTCTWTRKDGSVTSSTFEALQKEQQFNGRVATPVGGVALLAGVAIMWRWRKRQAQDGQKVFKNLMGPQLS